jgi:hypothetical protein
LNSLKLIPIIKYKIAKIGSHKIYLLCSIIFQFLKQQIDIITCINQLGNEKSEFWITMSIDITKTTIKWFPILKFIKHNIYIKCYYNFSFEILQCHFIIMMYTISGMGAMHQLNCISHGFRLVTRLTIYYLWCVLNVNRGLLIVQRWRWIGCKLKKKFSLE